MKLLRNIKTECMKRFVFLCIATLALSSCKFFSGIFTPGQGKSGTVNKRWNITDEAGKEKSPDSVVVTGAQYIPLFGRNEKGVNPDIEGSWELTSMEGLVVRGDVIERFKTIEASKYKVSNNTDSVIYSEGGAKITPKQRDNYHIPERPSINFYGANETFSGFSGCNRYSGRYEMPDSNSITLKNATPSTKMVCIGDYDENQFIENLHKVNKFKGSDEKLELMQGDSVILTFGRKKQ